MLNTLLLTPSLIPQMTQTFGSSAIIMSPLFELFLLVVAVLLIIAFFRYTQANSFWRDVLTGYGLFELLKNGFNYLFTSNQNQNGRIVEPQNIIHVHPSSQGLFNNPHCANRHNSVIHVHHKNRHNGSFHTHDSSPVSHGF